MKGYKGYKANFWENEDTHLAGIQDIIGIKGIQSIRDPILRKYDTFSTSIKGKIGIQGIQSPLSDQCCPSTIV